MFDGIKFYVVPWDKGHPDLDDVALEGLKADDILFSIEDGKAYVRPELWSRLKARYRSLKKQR